MRANLDSSPAAPTHAGIERMAADLARQGWAICERFLDTDRTIELAHEARRLWEQGRFRPAGIGRGAARQMHAGIRGDSILWLDECDAPSMRDLVSSELERLRQALNAVTFLGLFEFEGHLAVYPPGAHYARHLDQFQDAGERRVSLALYLNESWDVRDGGGLRLYPPRRPQAVEIAPQGGTLAAFLSGEIPHEVRPARQPRFSLSGWFRCRPVA